MIISENSENQRHEYDQEIKNGKTIQQIIEICRRIPPVQCSGDTVDEYGKIFMRYLKTKKGKRLQNIRSKNTYWKYRRAIELSVKGMSEKIFEISEKDGKIDEEYMKLLENFLEVLKVNGLLDPPSRCPIKNPKPKKSKRGSLSGLPKNWQEIFWKNIPQQSKYCPQVAILILSGARPDEIQTGVEVESDHKDKKLFISIQGSKRGQKDENGQKRRRLRIDFSDSDPSSPEVCLANMTKETSRIIHCENTKRLTDFVTYWGIKLFGKKDNGISPYSFRNQFSSDLKRNPKFGKNEIAQMMGHRSDRTQKKYGSFMQGRGGRGIDGVDATDEVRQYEQTGKVPWVRMSSKGKMTN